MSFQIIRNDITKVKADAIVKFRQSQAGLCHGNGWVDLCRGRFGVSRSRAVTYECDGVGTALNFDVMSKLVSCARKAGSAKCMSDVLDCDSPLESIREDYSNRHK